MLHIPEIVGRIFSLAWYRPDNVEGEGEYEFSPWRDLYALARTSRYFSTLALPELWRLVELSQHQRAIQAMLDKKVSETQTLPA